MQGRSTDAATSGQTVSAHAAQAIDDATAAAVIGGLQSRFEGQAVQFRLGDVVSERASLRTIALHGAGAIRFEGKDSWMPIRFDVLYDTDTQTVQSPSITLGATTSVSFSGSESSNAKISKVGETSLASAAL